MARQQADEETPLLQQQPKKRTPIPWGQFTIVLFLQLTEPLTSQVIYPFAPQLIRDIGITNGDETQVGYYVGLMPMSQWCFESFLGLIFDVTSIVVELTDSTNIARAYAYQPIAWSTGGTLGPLIGGSLARPAERYPELFGNNKFLKKYPYFLPCAVPATYAAVAWLVTFLYLKETLKSPVSISQLFKSRKDKVSLPAKCAVSQEPLGRQGQDVHDEEEPLPLRDLLTSRVLLAAGNYASLSLVDIAFRAIQPLFLSTPVAFGGLGLSLPVIGNILSAYGVCNGAFQVFFFQSIHDHFGSKRTFIAGMACAFPCFIAFPIINALAKSHGVTTLVWAAVALQALVSIGLSLSYGENNQDM
ncbi:hypothetical protein C0992_010755 [Termitomyces sp. T32_za158]|nr:hypothetical protein C0992_010755 [Termitomyces sp. T32_za158]